MFQIFRQRNWNICADNRYKYVQINFSTLKNQEEKEACITVPKPNISIISLFYYSIRCSATFPNMFRDLPTKNWDLNLRTLIANVIILITKTSIKSRWKNYSLCSYFLAFYLTEIFRCQGKWEEITSFVISISILE